MIAAGILLIVGGIPGMIISVFLLYHDVHSGIYRDRQGAIFFGGIMTIAVGVTGGLFLLTGNSIVKRRWKAKEKILPK